MSIAGTDGIRIDRFIEECDAFRRRFAGKET